MPRPGDRARCGPPIGERHRARVDRRQHAALATRGREQRDAVGAHRDRGTAAARAEVDAAGAHDLEALGVHHRHQALSGIDDVEGTPVGRGNDRLRGALPAPHHLGQPGAIRPAVAQVQHVHERLLGPIPAGALAGAARPGCPGPARPAVGIGAADVLVRVRIGAGLVRVQGVHLRGDRVEHLPEPHPGMRCGGVLNRPRTGRTSRSRARARPPGRPPGVSAGRYWIRNSRSSSIENASGS